MALPYRTGFGRIIGFPIQICFGVGLSPVDIGSSSFAGFETGIGHESVRSANSVSLASWFNSRRTLLSPTLRLVGKSFVSKIYILGFHFFAKIECRLSGLSRLFLGAALFCYFSSSCALLPSLLSSPAARPTALPCQKSTFTDNLLG